MQVEIVASPDALAPRSADAFAALIGECIAQRGRCLLAVSGGTEPWRAFRRLAALPIAWHAVHVFQVDERAAPAGHPERNWTHLEENLLRRVPIPRDQCHPMPVDETPLEAAAARYGAQLRSIAGSPPILDVVHLGLGDDGHTASLVPGDPVLEVNDADVAVTTTYRGWRRMTLTFPAIDRARCILWLVGGDGKKQALRRLIEGDAGIPAGRIRRDNALLLADRTTAGQDDASA
jgi:6-phosphogluconolactonase